LTSQRRIAVLLATYNGAAHLEEQLQSLAGQDCGEIDLYVSDDGSEDGTLGIVADWRAKWRKGRLVVFDGPRQGYCENFRSMMQRDIQGADYVAFCDQDDIWEPDKLSSGIAALEARAPDTPGYYCSRTRLIEEDGALLGNSPLFQKPPSFRNAIVQSLGGGNTVILNAKGFDMVARSAARTGFVSHDWWCYMLISGAGGVAIYDPVPKILYRQHASNLVGSNTGLKARARRLRMMLTGRFRAWNDVNLAALAACDDMLNDDSRDVIRQFESMRAAGMISRVQAYLQAGIYRQTLAGNLGLIAALLFKRL
jgi:glycosyltransferase involved in cell wall biosynthesis